MVRPVRRWPGLGPLRCCNWSQDKNRKGGGTDSGTIPQTGQIDGIGAAAGPGEHGRLLLPPLDAARLDKSHQPPDRGSCDHGVC